MSERAVRIVDDYMKCLLTGAVCAFVGYQAAVYHAGQPPPPQIVPEHENLAVKFDSFVPYYSPVVLSREQLAWSVAITTMPETTVVLRFLGDANFETSKTVFGMKPSVIAWASPEKRPCEITMRSGFNLKFRPRDQSSGEWEDTRIADTLAHELLHCVNGRWHPQ